MARARSGEEKKRESRAPAVEPVPFIPGSAEATAVASLIPKVLSRSKIRLRVSRSSGGVSVAPDYPDPTAGLLLLMNEFGTVDADFVEAVMLQIAKLSTADAAPEQKSLNHALAML